MFASIVPDAARECHTARRAIAQSGVAAGENQAVKKNRDIVFLFFENNVPVLPSFGEYCIYRRNSTGSFSGAGPVDLRVMSLACRSSVLMGMPPMRLVIA